MQSVNPATGQLIREYNTHSPRDIEQILTQASTAFNSWRQASFMERERLLLELISQLTGNLDQLARLMTNEMGKPLKQARAEVEKCRTVCDYYAQNGAKFLVPTSVENEVDQGYVSYQPLGVILGIMPWNFPYWQVFRYAIPTIMAGNTTILKHAANVSGCALVIEQLFRQAGFPEGVFQTLLVESNHMNEIIADPRIRAVTLTGSIAAGKAVASQAGKYVKKCVLELGGSDPYIILEDADLNQAVDICIKGRLQNTGQSCIAAKRFIVVDKVRDEFEHKLLTKFEDITFGDPTTDEHLLGPMARHDLRDALNEQVARSIDQGAKLLIGGYIPDHPGAYYPATILSDIKSGMAAYKEELFGPVACILPAKDEVDAIRIANDSPFGLGAAVFTRDLAKGQRIAEQELDAGSCFVNNLVHSDARFPFGGTKQSGYGRELGEFGIKEFVNIKTVRIWTKYPV